MEVLAVEFPLSWLLFLASLLLLYKYFTRTWGTWSRQGIPELKPWIIVGSRPTVYKGVVHLEDLKYRRRFGQTWGEYEGCHPILFTTDPDLVKVVTVKEFSNFADRRNFEVKQEIFRNNLALLQGEQWKAMRSLLGPGFTGSRMKNAVDTFLESAKTLTQLLKRDGKDGKKGLEITRYFSCFGLDVLASYGFGVEVSSLENTETPFVKNALRLFTCADLGNPMIVFALAFPKILSFLDVFPPDAHDFFVKTIQDIVKARKDGPDSGLRKDYVDIILQAIKQSEENKEYKRMGITQKLLEEQLMLFFIAGYDTMKTSMSFTSYYLALHPDIQSQVREEILDAIKETDGEVRHGTLSKLPLMDACIAESFRLQPPVNRLERVAKRDFHYKNIFIPKGTVVQIPTYTLHREPEEFPDPEVWKPKRFLEGNQTHNPYAYIPFGSGPRICIGMRLAQDIMRFAFVHVLKELEIVRTPETPEKVEYMEGLHFAMQPTNLVVGFRSLH
ncbi:unnamed protein product [Darwinula stevensoni]|uniref:Cytochrome P450 n=1 Tax=Darwinula stevensoni TaxID=69355 RepID=A0A7R9FQR9_9CRUS|nr:unnamed protein product [Darwinula stevensoni]CAG0899655.1 unnamed protein product [Darwinula stevensoni]